MDAANDSALVSVGPAFNMSRDTDPPSIQFAIVGEHDWTETATAVFSLIVDPLSILGFPGRLSCGMAIPHGARHGM